jgi:hypothetical protein
VEFVILESLISQKNMNAKHGMKREFRQELKMLKSFKFHLLFQNLELVMIQTLVPKKSIKFLTNVIKYWPDGLIGNSRSLKISQPQLV